MERLHRDRTAVGLGVAGHDDAVRIDARCHDIGEPHVVSADRRGDQRGVLVGAALAEPARFAVPDDVVVPGSGTGDRLAVQCRAPVSARPSIGLAASGRGACAGRTASAAREPARPGW